MQDTDVNLSSPLTVLRGVGPLLAEKLKRLNLHQVADLLFLLPLRYEDRTKLQKIGSLRPGMRCLTSGEVLLAETVYRGRRSLLVRVGDGQNLVDMIYVENAAAAHLLAADALQLGGPVAGRPYFISQGEPVNCWSWIDQILVAAGEKPVKRAISFKKVGALKGSVCKEVQPSKPESLVINCTSTSLNLREKC